MRLVFKDVPAIYGFSSVAPLGPVAGAILRRHLDTQRHGRRRHRPAERAPAAARSPRMLMTVTSGMRDNDALAAHRRDVCQFADERLGRRKQGGLRALHLFEREAAEARMFLPRLERFAAGLDAGDPRRARRRGGAARDRHRQDRARALSRPGARCRLRGGARAHDRARRELRLAVARRGEREELAQMWTEQVERNAITPAEVDLACSAQRGGRLRRPACPRWSSLARPPRVGSIRNPCLPRKLRRHANTSCGPLPAATTRRAARPGLPASSAGRGGRRVARSDGRHRAESVPSVQVRALHALARNALSDPASLHELVRLYPLTESVGVQTAIAGVLLRSDYAGIASPEVVATLRTRRVSAPTRAGRHRRADP